MIEGTVVDDQARPVPLCRLSIPSCCGERLVEGPLGGDVTVVNGAFRWAVEGVAPLVIIVRSPQDAEGRPLNLRARSVRLEETPTEPTLIALEVGLTLTGRVLDAEGAPVAGVVLGAQEASAASGADGSFSLVGLEPGNAWLAVEPPRGYVKPGFRSVRIGAADVIVRLERGVTLTGSVLDPEGRPVRYGWVEATWGATPTGPAGEAEASLADNGRFTLRGLPLQARLTLRAEAGDSETPDFGPGIREGVLPGQGDVVIHLPTGATVSGQVVEADGSPAEDATVWVRPGRAGSASVGVEADEQGCFTLRSLPPGKVQLSVEVEGLFGGTEVTTNAPATDLRIVLPRRVPIHGRIVGAGAGGNWWAWAWRSTVPGERTERMEVGADGRFTLRDTSEAGPWMLGASSSDGRYALGGPVPGGATGVELEARQGGVLEGQVRTASGLPLASAGRIELSGQGWNRETLFFEQGAFRFQGLPPGRYRLSAEASEGSASVEEEVTSGTRRVDLVIEAPK